jgi:quercetin dioxygenase-like cupin family protein
MDFTNARKELAVKTPTFPDRIRALEPFSNRFDAFRLAGDGCDVLFACYPAGMSIEPHRHDTENWGVVTRGELCLTLGDRERRFAPGEWYHVPAQALHGARFERDTESIEFWFAVESPAALPSKARSAA